MNESLGVTNPARVKLFAILMDFAKEIVVGWVACAYRGIGQDIIGRDLCLYLLNFAEDYVNDIAEKIYTREDDYVNGWFDKMAEINLGLATDPMELFQVVVHIALTTLNTLKIDDLITLDYLLDMKNIAARIGEMVQTHAHNAILLQGSACHQPRPKGKAFNFSAESRKK